MQDNILSGSSRKAFSCFHISLRRLTSKVNSGIRSTLYGYGQRVRSLFDVLFLVFRRKRRARFPITIEYVHVKFAHNRNGSSMLGIGISSSDVLVRG